MTRFTPEEVELHVHAAAESMLDNLAHDYWRLPTRNVPSAARAVWDKETLPALVRYCQEIYRANVPPLKRIVAVLDVEDEEGIDRALIEGVPTVQAVVDVRGWDDETGLALQMAPSPGEPEQAALEDQAAEHDEARRLTRASFGNWEPGSVPEREWENRLSEIRNAADYLRSEKVWRVEYNRPWGQNEKVIWVEAATRNEAIAGDESFLYLSPPAVRVLSCRRAGIEDLPEYVESLARDFGWKR